MEGQDLFLNPNKWDTIDEEEIGDIPTANNWSYCSKTNRKRERKSTIRAHNQ